jgi:hypothetical protein
MYPGSCPYLRQAPGAYSRTSLSRIFPRNRQLRLSWSARSTCPRKYFRRLFSFPLSALSQPGWWLRADGRELNEKLGSGSDRETGPVAQVARAHP